MLQHFAASHSVKLVAVSIGGNNFSFASIVQTWSPIPNGSGFRYPEWGWSRQASGGCGFWNAEANWANATALPTIDGAVSNAAAQAALPNVRTMRLASAFSGGRLCENTVGLLEEKGLSSWTNAGAVDNTERINQIRTVIAIFPPYQIQEDLHPNYWAQLALRSCVRQAYNDGSVPGGTCSIASKGLDGLGEPNMSLH